jgi:hypothetical protein
MIKTDKTNKTDKKFITLKDDNNIIGYAILDEKINYPIILPPGNMLFEFNKSIIEKFGKLQINSPHNFNRYGFDLI